MRVIINPSAKSDAFVVLFQNLKTFTDSLNIRFTEEGISIQTMDNSHVSVVELQIPATWFSEYECNENLTLGVHVGILAKILASKDKSQILTIVYNGENNSDNLEIHFTSSIIVEATTIDKEVNKKTKITDVKIYDTHFEIPLVDIESEQIEIPPIDYAAEFSLSSLNFSNIVSQLKLFGDTMDIECSEEKIILYSRGVENGKMSVEIDIDDLTEFSINEGQQLCLSFALNYLHNICAFHKLAKEIELKVCNDYPLCAAYSLGDNATLRFYLAPKISETD
jgi:proliferating cell nuclear antigen